MVPLAYSPLLANRPVTSVALVPTAGEALVLAAYGPLGAELGAEELLKVRGGGEVEWEREREAER
jgi:hypothetical protein